jgi:uncharacterized protein (TIRG00374 family)
LALTRHFPAAKTIVKGLLKAALSIGLAAYLLSKFNLAFVREHLQDAHWGFVAAALALHVVGYFISAWRWQTLLAAQGTVAPMRRLVSSYAIAAFFANFLPGGVGGDVVRVYDGAVASRSLAKALNVVVFERLLGLSVLALFAGLGLAFGDPRLASREVVALTAVLLAGLVLVWLVVSVEPFRAGIGKLFGALPRRLRHARAIEFANAFEPYRRRPRVVVEAVAISLLYQVLIVATFVLTDWALSINASLAFYLVAVPVVSVVTMLPISVNGIGVREGAFVFLFTRAGLSGNLGLVLSILYYVSTVAVSLLGGVIYVLRPSRKRSPSTEVLADPAEQTTSPARVNRRNQGKLE